MRISDWSSDVCSSDLTPPQAGQPAHGMATCQPLSAATGGRRDRARYRGARNARDPLSIQGNDRQRLHRRRRHETLTGRSEEHTSELQSLMRISYAVFCLKKKKKKQINNQ